MMNTGNHRVLGTYAFTHATAPGPGMVDYVPLPPDPLCFDSPSLDFDCLPHSVYTLDRELRRFFIYLTCY